MPFQGVLRLFGGGTTPLMGASPAIGGSRAGGWATELFHPLLASMDHERAPILQHGAVQKHEGAHAFGFGFESVGQIKCAKWAQSE